MKMTEEETFIGRQAERNQLNAMLHSGRAEFIAVYGRRRVGKTFLIKHVLGTGTDHVFFHITGARNGSMAEQIADFTRVLSNIFFGGNLALVPPKNWKAAFELLTQTIRQMTGLQKKIVLFFDELPWLAGRRSGFIEALDYYWNRYWADMPVLKLVVCGSAASWMINVLISHKGGLHNRLSGEIALSPFNLYETKAFLISRGLHYKDYQVLQLFMVTGGIPYYLDFVKKHLSVIQNIDQLCFQKNGLLVGEFAKLYAALFENADSYEELVRLIARKRQGVEQRTLVEYAKLSSSGGRLKKRLTALEQSGFIVSFVPYGFKRRRVFYRLIDEYSLFYLAWIEPAMNNIRKLEESQGYWQEKSRLPEWHAWAGYAFESVCFRHLAQIRHALGIPVTAAVGSWQYIPRNSKEQGAQIDLLFDRDDNTITVCEIKHTREPWQLNREEAQKLLKKVEVFQSRTKTAKDVQIVLISPQPIGQTMYSEELIAHNVILDDLVQKR